MSTPVMNPEPGPQHAGRPVTTLFKWVGILLLFAAVSAASAYGVFEWRMQAERASAASLRAETLQEVEALKAQQSELEAKMKVVDEAATATGLLLQQDGETTGLQARLAEIDTLKVDLKKTQEEIDAKLKSAERSVVEQVAKQGKETAQALSLELRWKSILIKAQGEVLLAQVHWVEGNRGLAKDELALAARSLQLALNEAPEANKPPIKKVVDLAEQTRSAMILEQSSARDSINLLWHQVSELLAPPAAN